jgi:hypothetical protein
VRARESRGGGRRVCELCLIYNCLAEEALMEFGLGTEKSVRWMFRLFLLMIGLHWEVFSFHKDHNRSDERKLHALKKTKSISMALYCSHNLSR